MKLGEFLSQQGAGARQAPTRTARVKLVGVDGQMLGRVADARAEIAFVPEAARQEALRDADRAIRDLYGKDPPPDERRDDEHKYHILHRALRDCDDPRQPFADSVRELKGALVLAEAARIWAEYCQFVEEEFPDSVDTETFERMVEEAKKASLPGLISSYGFDAVRRSMPGLLALLRS